jgi:hypothetical protein
MLMAGISPFVAARRLSSAGVRGLLLGSAEFGFGFELDLASVPWASLFAARLADLGLGLVGKCVVFVALAAELVASRSQIRSAPRAASRHLV